MRSFASPELRHNIVEWDGGFRRRPPGHLYEKGPTMGERRRRRRRMMMAYHEAADAVLARRQGLALLWHNVFASLLFKDLPFGNMGTAETAAEG